MTTTLSPLKFTLPIGENTHNFSISEMDEFRDQLSYLGGDFSGNNVSATYKSPTKDKLKSVIAMADGFAFYFPDQKKINIYFSSKYFTSYELKEILEDSHALQPKYISIYPVQANFSLGVIVNRGEILGRLSGEIFHIELLTQNNKETGSKYYINPVDWFRWINYKKLLDISDSIFQ